MKGRAMRRGLAASGLVVMFTIATAAPSAACGGLIGANGSVNLLKTSTLAAYDDGVEHYVTVFEFAGGGAKFGSIVPLPAIPSDVEKGGKWTLQRLAEEVAPPVRRAFKFGVASAAGEAADAAVVMTANVDALDVTIVKGGGDAVGRWALEEGFRLPPDAPEVLDFYAKRSPVFMAVAFDSKRAAELGRLEGDGIPVHLTIPTHNPWVPLRILGLGKQSVEPIQADVFLLTPNQPRMLPLPADQGAGSGISIERSEPASEDLLRDLGSDRGMEWLRDSGMWFTYVQVDGKAGVLTHDLAIDPTGAGAPSPVAAGLVEPLRVEVPADVNVWPWVTAILFGIAVLWGVDRVTGPALPKP
jgi:hypothetical protein